MTAFCELPTLGPWALTHPSDVGVGAGLYGQPEGTWDRLNRMRMEVDPAENSHWVVLDTLTEDLTTAG